MQTSGEMGFTCLEKIISLQLYRHSQLRTIEVTRTTIGAPEGKYGETGKT